MTSPSTTGRRPLWLIIVVAVLVGLLALGVLSVAAYMLPWGGNPGPLAVVPSAPTRSATLDATPSPGPTPEPTTAPSPTPELTAVVDVRCGPGAPTLGSNRVRTSPDGVRLHVTSQPGWELGIEHSGGLESVGLDAAIQDVVIRIAPGNVTVVCGEMGSPELPTGSALRIEDPEGWYRSKAIGDGAGSCATGFFDYAAGARGKAVDPIVQARAILRGLQAGDVVERAGYATDTGSVRVVRDGTVIGVMDFSDDRHGGWLPSQSTLCGGLGGG